jgi:ABC-2 type transport system ATP-binding protein
VGRYEVREIIRELRGEGVTVFLNSHYLSEVEVTCDRVAIVKGGRLMRVGTLAELTQGANEVEIEARGLDGETLAGLARWGEVTADAETPVGMRKVTLQMTGDDALPQIAAYVVGRGAQLYALTPQRPSLEELFMRVMAEERA